jgi:hypothetical protein
MGSLFKTNYSIIVDDLLFIGLGHVGQTILQSKNILSKDCGMACAIDPI